MCSRLKFKGDTKLYGISKQDNAKKSQKLIFSLMVYKLNVFVGKP